MELFLEIFKFDVFLPLLTLILIIFTIIKHNSSKVKNPPPGPFPWPIIGNILQLGEYPHLTFTKYMKQYGDVFEIKLGSMPVIVLNGSHTIKQALIKQGESFAGRPDLYTFSLIGYGGSMTFNEKYGESWNLHKKIAKQALRNLSLTQAKNSTCSCLLEEQTCFEASELVKIFLELSEKEGSFDPIGTLTSSVANVICALCFGKRYDHNDSEFLAIVQINQDVLRIISTGNAADIFPIFRYLPSPSLRLVFNFIKKMKNFMNSNIKEHYISYDKNCIRDITDALIALCEEKNEERSVQSLTNKQIVSTVNDIFGAGFDTITTGLLWCLVYLIEYPHIQRRIHSEIDENLALNMLPTYEYKSSMPYTEAFICEVFRHAAYVPLTIPHCTTEDTLLNGYFIPKDTCVFINQHQVNHDEVLWVNPSVFCPDRFLDEKGQINKETVEKVMIFGIGKRRCLGDNVARMEMFIFLTTILSQLKVENPTGQKIDLSPNFGLTMKPKPFKIKITQR